MCKYHPLASQSTKYRYVTAPATSSQGNRTNTTTTTIIITQSCGSGRDQKRYSYSVMQHTTCLNIGYVTINIVWRYDRRNNFTKLHDRGQAAWNCITPHYISWRGTTPVHLIISQPWPELLCVWVWSLLSHQTDITLLPSPRSNTPVVI